MAKNPFNTLSLFPSNPKKKFYSLPALEKTTGLPIHRLPVSIRILLESMLRNCDGKKIKEEEILTLAKWKAKDVGEGNVPFVVSRVILQDFTGVPLLVDLATMRDAAAACGLDPKKIEPIVPVDLVVDHSVQVDRAGTSDAYLFNLQIEFSRNQERYEFLNWGQSAFSTFRVVPPGIGIVHQVNLEYLASVVTEKDDLLFFDTLVGTDSHTTMINGLGVVGWGVGGIEAEVAMLGQPYFMQMPEVVGFYLEGALQEGVTATDLTLHITEKLRQAKVVGKFVEFFGPGAASLSVADRATIGNMAPEYGATMGFFPVDDKTLEYLQFSGRPTELVLLVKEYMQAQGVFGFANQGELDFSSVLSLDLKTVRPCTAGPKRPQDRIELGCMKQQFDDLFTKPLTEGGYGKKRDERNKSAKVHSQGNFHVHEMHITGGVEALSNKDKGWSEEEMVMNRPITKEVINPGYTQHKSHALTLEHGSVVIAAITSCTNTSNPHVMLAAGLLAKRAIERGLKIDPKVKTSLAPGSRVVTDYLEKTGLQKYLNQLGFQLVAYGCTTCIGNSGPLDEKIEEAIKEHDLIVASVLSGNRNFEARIHGAVKANYLMSPPLVVAFALAGKVDIDFTKEPLGKDMAGKPVFLKEIWPSNEDIQKALAKGLSAAMFKEKYAQVFTGNPIWNQIQVKKSARYQWDPKSTYIRTPPFFENFEKDPPSLPLLEKMRPLAFFGDSVTTDHISPAGSFKATVPAGQYLFSCGVEEGDFNSYGSRRGNHEVMMRGTFANVRIRNLMLKGKEGGFTYLMPERKEMTIFEACQQYEKRKTPLILFAGKDYGMGSSRDWAAKGTALLGVKAVVAKSFERIHRSNLVGMGVLPLEFQEGEDWQSLCLTGEETFSLKGFEKGLSPHQKITLEIYQPNGKKKETQLTARLDTPVDVDYYRHGGILPYVLRQLMHA